MPISIDQVYAKALTEKNEENQRERYKEHKDKFHASGAGYCLKKHWFGLMKVETIQPDDRVMRLFELGNIVHDSIQNSLIKQFNGKEPLLTSKDKPTRAAIEMEIKVPEWNVRGFADIILLNVPLIDGVSITELRDIKTMAAYKWTKKFGMAKNRERNPSHQNELQLATYCKGLIKMREQDESIQVQTENGIEYYKIDDTIIMHLDFYKKDDSAMKSIIISKDFIDKAEEYWMKVKWFIEDNPIYTNEEALNNILMQKQPEVGQVGVPFETWECGYCDYKNICLGRLVSKTELKKQQAADRKARKV